ncbi:MAG: hypothetical protein HY831_01960 [Candidatus Aenigmarchaeota archaeon]|nr:hypothetical protein [Candidatus Aenigmarchaeota archaeon]
MALEIKTVGLIIIVVLVSVVLGVFFISYSGTAITNIKDCKTAGGVCTTSCKEGITSNAKCENINTEQTQEGTVITKYLPGKEPVCCLSNQK